MLFIISGCILLTVFLWVIIIYRSWQQYRQVNMRLDHYGIKQTESDTSTNSEKDRQPVLRTIIDKIALVISDRISKDQKSKLRQKLVMAGSPGNLQPSEFIALKVVICLLVAMVAISVKVPVLYFILALLGGWVVPDIYLNQLVNKRQLAISLATPDVLDLLTVSVEAGLGFDAAIARVAEKSDGPLAEEFQRVLYEIRIGKPRRDALRNLSDRTGVGYLQSFVAAIIQADQLGIGVGKILRIQATEIRRLRRQNAEEEAMKAPIKMLIPLVVLVFPALFIVLLGPAAINLLSTL